VTYLVENVIVSLVHRRRDDSDLFEQVLDGERAADAIAVVERDMQVLAEARRVVVSNRLCVSERLKKRIGVLNASE
jgi:hypothetical protein